MLGQRSLPRLAYRDGRVTQGARALPDEVAVALSYNGSTQAVMMATPADLEDFARGFTLTEGIATPDEIDSITAVETPQGIDLQIWLRAEAADRQARRRRSMAGPVGCGLCGIDSLQEAMRHPRPLGPDVFRMRPAQVLTALQELERHQPLHDITRAAHGAAFWAEGAIRLSREDVGRHNALDKLIGALMHADAGTGAQARRGALILTCRVSIDMVQKACAARLPVVIAVSAPTSAAVAMADTAGLTLIGLARPDSFEIFTHPARIEPEESADVA